MKNFLKKLFDLLPKNVWPISVYYRFAENEQSLTASLERQRHELDAARDDLSTVLDELTSAENIIFSETGSILFFHGGAGNHGCEAIVRTLCKLSLKTPEDILLLSLNKHEDLQFGLDQTVGYIKKSSLSADELKDHRFKNGTVALSIGGDNYCYGDLDRERLAAYSRLFLSKGIRTALVGCSIEPSVLEDENVLCDLDSLTLITARESISYNALLAKGISRNTHLIPDSAFALDAKYEPLPEGFEPDNTIGINVSNMIEDISGLARENLQVLIRYILNETAYQIAFIPHVVQAINDDGAALQALYESYKDSGRVVLIENCDCQTLKGYIARLKMFIGARTHATIAAYSSCVPTVALGYSVKSRGIAQDIFGTDENYVISMRDLKTTGEIKDAFVWLCDHEQDIRRHLQQTMPEYIGRTSLLDEHIQALRRSDEPVLPLANLKECVGCGNCAKVCPLGAVQMITSAAGFVERKVDYLKCTHCDACKAVCIMGAPQIRHQTNDCFAAVNQDVSERMASSSGGIFVKLASRVLDEGGAVYGAAFDHRLKLRHIRVTDPTELPRLLGSKYLESRLDGIFRQVRSDLSRGEPVLFSGTPCQVKSLQLFLGRDYDNLLLVDFICHGVPAPAVFDQRKAQMERKHHSKLTHVNFRDKQSGWRDYSVTYAFENGRRVSITHGADTYMQLFLQNKILRESCYHCAANNYRSGSDITLGDYWNGQSKHPNFDDDKGISAVLTHSEKGRAFFEKTGNISSEGADLRWLETFNPCLVKNAEKPYDTARFIKRNYIPEIQEETAQSPLVSIVTSTYNGAAFLDRYFTEMAKQTYNNFEIVIVNDGSADNTKEIVARWIEKFSRIRPTVRIQYLYQENGGVAKGYQTGIRKIAGEFFSCVADDDFFDPDYITEHVKLFLADDSCNIIQCDSYYGSFDKHGNYVIKRKFFDLLEQKGGNLFYNAIKEENFVFPKFMIRTSEFNRINPNCDMYISRGGQSWQILLPILYYNPVHIIDMPLFYYVFREDSHGNSIFHNDALYLERIAEHEKILVNTVRRMNIPEEPEVLAMIEEKYKKIRGAMEKKTLNKAGVNDHEPIFADTNSSI